MSNGTRFTLSFNLNLTNDERIEMSELYQKAFNAEKTYEGTPPDGDDIHIMLDIYGLGILIGPGSATGKGLKDPICCEVSYSDYNEFSKAYEILSKEGKSHSLEGPYPWAEKLGLIEDKFGIGWALYYNE